MKKLLQFLLVMAFVSTLAGQDTPRKDVSEADKTPKFYKLTYLIYEVEDGKKINERSYTLPVSTENGRAQDSRLRVGTRVPINAGEKGVQYLDVGLNIDCNVLELADKFVVFTDLEISSFALGGVAADHNTTGNPVFRNIRQHFSTLVAPGKPTLVSTMDDINSTKRMQVEVTATRIQ